MEWLTVRDPLRHWAGLVVLIATSVVDEVAQMALILRQADSSIRLTGVASVLLLGMIGAVLVGPLSARLLTAVGPTWTLVTVFFSQISVLLGGALLAQEVVLLGVACVLGASGAVYWSAVLSVVPEIATRLGVSIDRVNSVVQTIRNFGFVVGPSLGAVLAVVLSLQLLFSLLVGVVAVSLGLVLLVLPRIVDGAGSGDPEGSKNLNILSGISELFRRRKARIVLFAFLPVVATTVSLNVGLVFIVTKDMELSASYYGFLVACLSVGLTLGPSLAPTLIRLTSPANISLGAGLVIGLTLIFVSRANSLPILILSLLVGGIANGLINATVASLILTETAAEKRTVTMPAFVALTQTSVLCGYSAVAFLPTNAAATAVLVGGGLAAVVSATILVIKLRSEKQLERKASAP